MPPPARCLPSTRKPTVYLSARAMRLPTSTVKRWLSASASGLLVAFTQPTATSAPVPIHWTRAMVPVAKVAPMAMAAVAAFPRGVTIFLKNAVPMFPSASSMGIPPGAPTWTMSPAFLCVAVPLPARAAPAIFRTPTAPSQLGAIISLNQDVRTFPSVLPVANIPLGAATSATPRGSLLVGVMA